MATTTNYGWTTPDDTALVKDGAAAIRTLGSSVDTTTKNLNPSTTLGDMEYRSSTSNVNTRLPLGTASQQLRVNSGATAPEWFTPTPSGGMTLISTTTLSGTSVSLSSIAATYKHLLVVVSNITTSAGFYFYCKFNNSSIAEFNSWDMGSAAGTVSTYQAADFQFNSNTAIANTGAINTASLWLYNYASATERKNFAANFGYRTSGGVSRTALAGGTVNTTSAINELVFNAGGSTTFSGGTVLLYGVS